MSIFRCPAVVTPIVVDSLSDPLQPDARSAARVGPSAVLRLVRLFALLVAVLGGGLLLTEHVAALTVERSPDVTVEQGDPGIRSWVIRNDGNAPFICASGPRLLYLTIDGIQATTQCANGVAYYGTATTPSQPGTYVTSLQQILVDEGYYYTLSPASSVTLIVRPAAVVGITGVVNGGTYGPGAGIPGCALANPLRTGDEAFASVALANGSSANVYPQQRTVTCRYQSSPTAPVRLASATYTITGPTPGAPPNFTRLPPPVIDVTLPFEASGSVPGATVSFIIAATDDEGPATVTCRENGAIVNSPRVFAVGSHPISCIASDLDGNSSGTRQFTIIVRPLVADQTITLRQDETRTFDLRAGETVGSTSGVSRVPSSPTLGTLTAINGAVFRYTPNPSPLILQPTTDTIPFTVTQNGVTSRTGTITVNLLPGGVPVSATTNPVNLTTPEDTPIQFTLPIVNTDNDPLTVTTLGGPATANGSTGGTGLARTYAPNRDFAGSDTFTVRVSDPTSSVDVVVNVTVTPVNDPPTARDDTLTGVMAGVTSTLTTELTANDSSGDANDPLTITAVSDVTGGTALLRSGAVIFRPGPAGPGSFRYTVTDTGGLTASATATFTIAPGTTPPVADPKSLDTAEDVPLSVTLTGSGGNGNALVATVVTSPTYGTLAGTGSELIYTPAPNDNRTDSFTYTVSDGTTTSALATVTIAIVPINDPPSAGDDDLAPSIAGVTRTIPAADLLANDSPGVGEATTDTLTITGVDSAIGGTATLVSGNVRFVPSGPGAASFRYTVTDDGTLTASASVRFTVTAANQPPTASPQTLATGTGTPLAITLAGSDPDGNPLTFAIVQPPAHGTLSGTAPNLTYTPATAYTGPDAFTFTVSDGTATSAPATISLTVTQANRPPVFTAATVPGKRTAEATSPAGAKVTYTAPTATDPDAGDRVTVACLPASGTTFRLGQTTVTCTATDRTGATATATFTVVVRDTTAPTIRYVGGPQAGQTYTQANLPPAPTCTATDAVSQVSPCRVYGYSTGVGWQAMVAGAYDSAGNVGAVVRIYRVIANPATASATPKPSGTPTVTGHSVTTTRQPTVTPAATPTAPPTATPRTRPTAPPTTTATPAPAATPVPATPTITPAPAVPTATPVPPDPTATPAPVAPTVPLVEEPTIPPSTEPTRPPRQ